MPVVDERLPTSVNTHSPLSALTSPHSRHPRCRPVERRSPQLPSVMPPRRRKRLDPALFQLPVQAIREGTYSDRSLVRACEILRGTRSAQRVTMQIACEGPGFLGGIDEAVALVHAASSNQATVPPESETTVKAWPPAPATAPSVCRILRRRHDFALCEWS